jgi:TRAP-type C4-dicarboxylate transport system permease small subunit
MNTPLNRITRFSSTLLAIGSGLSMLGVFAIILINATRRYTIGKSLEWGEELPVYLAIYGIMFGMAWAYMQDRHVSFSILTGIIPKALARWLALVVDLVMILSGVLLSYSGYLFAEKRGGIDSSGLVNTASELKKVTGWDSIATFGQMYPYQFAMAIGGALLAIAALLRLLNRLQEET